MDRQNEIRKKMGLPEKDKSGNKQIDLNDARKQSLMNTINEVKGQQDTDLKSKVNLVNIIKQIKEEKTASRPWYQKAIDVVTPGAQYREAEKGETVMGDIKGGLVGATKGLGSTLVGAGELGSKLMSPIINPNLALADIVSKGIKDEKIDWGAELKKAYGGTTVEPVSQMAEKARTALTPKTSEEQVGFIAEQIAEFLVPASKITKAGKLAELTAKGSAKGTGLIAKVAPFAAKVGTESGIVALQQAVQQGKVDKDTLTMALMTAAFPIAGVGASKMKNVLSKALGGEKMAQSMIGSLIKPLQKDLAYGKNPMGAIPKEGIVAKSLDDLGEKVYAKQTQIGEEIGNTLKGVTKPVDISGYSLVIDDALKSAEMKAGTQPGLANRIAGAKTDIENYIKTQLGGKTQVTAEEANKLKQFVGDLKTWTGSATEDKLQNRLITDIYNKVKVGIEDVAPGIKGLNERWGNLKSASQAIGNTLNNEMRKNMLGFGNVAGGLAGAAFAPGDLKSKLKYGIAGFVAPSIAKKLKTPLLTGAAKALSTKSPQLGKLTQQAMTAAKNMPKFVPPKASTISKISQTTGNAANIGVNIARKVGQSLGGSWLRNFGAITGYGSSYWDAGLDVGGKYDTPIPAPFKGKVSAVIPTEKSGGFGNQVRIADGKGNELWISHLNKVGKLAVGKEIPAGTMIGTLGNTGNVLTSHGGKWEPPTDAERKSGAGAHLDLTIKKKDGKYMTAKEVEKYLTGLG